MCPNEEDVINSQPLLQQFVVYVYLKKYETIDLDELRFNIFKNSSSNEFRILPPSKDALLLQVLRSAYQAGWIWGNTLIQQNPPQTESWGWRFYNGNLKLRWKCQDAYTDLMKITSVCQCRITKCKSCKCAKSQIKCLKYCNCNKRCENV